jgi:hypothetical protein
LQYCKKDILFSIKFWLIAALTLGLAPFTPEPHIWGKLKWILGGAVGMQTMDWMDALMHGTPWIMLLISLLLAGYKKIKAAQGSL